MLTKIFLFGIFYFFIICFIALMILVIKAPTYIEKEDGSMLPVMRKGILKGL